MRLFIQFIKRPLREKVCLLEASILLAVFRAALLLIPFKRLAGLLGEHMLESKEYTLIECECLGHVILAVRSVKTMSRHLPWECKCLVQAVSLKKMLGWRGIESTLYLGVAKEDTFTAHAWLRVGDTVVIGDNGLQKYSVVSYFS